MNKFRYFLLICPIFTSSVGVTTPEPFGNVINISMQNLTNVTVLNRILYFNGSTLELAPRSKVNLAGNLIDHLDIESTQLELIDAGYCHIRQVNISSVYLKELRLDFNFLEVLSGDMIRSAHLETLSLNSNLIFAIRRETFKELPSLKVISLANNRILSLDDDAFAGNLLLDKLDLSHNKIVSLRLTFYGSTLSLAHNKLMLDEDFVAQMPYLYSLDLSYNNFVEIPPLKSTSLQNLGLRGNNISTAVLTSFVAMPRLEILDLRDNEFSVVFHPKLFMFNHIKELRLEGNPWKCKCDRVTFKFFQYLEGPPKLMDDLDLLKCSNNGQTWQGECKRRWMRYKQLSEPMQRFAFGCFAFIMVLIVSALTMVAFAKITCPQRRPSSYRSSSPVLNRQTPDLPPTYEDAVKLFASPTKEQDPPKYEDVELQRLTTAR